LLHQTQKTKYLIPLLALLTSTDGSALRDDIGQETKMLHHWQETKCLMPLLTLLRSRSHLALELQKKGMLHHC
jgi:hypothetical protein